MKSAWVVLVGMSLLASCKTEVAGQGSGGDTTASSAKLDVPAVASGEKNEQCTPACANIRRLMLAQLDNLPEDARKKAHDRADTTEKSELAMCNLRCQSGKIDAACAIGVERLSDLPKCVKVAAKP